MKCIRFPTDYKLQLLTSHFLLLIQSICASLFHKPWILLEVGPETQCDVVIFDHSLHVACLSVDVVTGPL